MKKLKKINKRAWFQGTIIGGKKLFWIFSSFVLIFSATYFYLVGSSVVNAAERAKISKEISRIAGETGELDAKYISLKNKITPEFARKNGFQEVSSTKYISRKPLGKAVSLKNEI